MYTGKTDKEAIEINGKRPMVSRKRRRSGVNIS